MQPLRATLNGHLAPVTNAQHHEANEYFEQANQEYERAKAAGEGTYDQ